MMKTRPVTRLASRATSPSQARPLPSRTAQQSPSQARNPRKSMRQIAYIPDTWMPEFHASLAGEEPWIRTSHQSGGAGGREQHQQSRKITY